MTTMTDMRAASLLICRLSLAMMVLSLGLVPSAGWGFESYEHKRMGDLALSVAQAYLLREKAVIPEPAREAIEKLRNAKPGYGQIAQCVDYRLIPEQILAYAWRHNKPTGSSGVPDSDTILSEDLDGECNRESARYMQASHNNHAHFQQDLLMSFRLWHLMAFALAKEEGNYYGALVANAIADHYLQDIFAPGHVMTPRDRATDVPATAMHDVHNWSGEQFVPVLTDDLRRILDYICTVDTSIAATGAPSCRQQAPDEILKQLIDDKEVPDERLAAALTLLLEASKPVEGSKPKPVTFRGDGHLWDPTTHALAQRTLMLAVEVQSIIDILTLEGNSFKKFHFSYVEKDGKPTAKVSAVKVDFGAYVLNMNTPRETALDADGGIVEPAPGTGSAPAASPEFSQWTEKRQAASGTDELVSYQSTTRASSLGLGMARESFSSGPKTGRSVVATELNLAGTFWDLSGWNKSLGSYVISPMIGYQWYREGDVRGSGPTGRVMLSVPETEFSIGPYLRYMSYPTNQGETRKWSAGFRIDSGFSSYFTFYLGVGQDYGTETDGSLHRGLLWTMGLQVTVPTSRIIPGWK